MDLNSVVNHVMNVLVSIDQSGKPFRNFCPGVGPYGEPQLVKLISEHLRSLKVRTETKRSPDLLIPGKWAIEFKIARPFGDNGREAEHWSVNLLHPYRGNVSLIGDCFKLLERNGPERLAVITIGYEHDPPKIDLTPLIESFEVIAHSIMKLHLSEGIEKCHRGLVHPVHQVVRVIAWEILRTPAG